MRAACILYAYTARHSSGQFCVQAHADACSCSCCDCVYWLQVPVAVAAWRGLLQGRFRLLDRWCSFITSSYKQLVVTEDTWTQVSELDLATALSLSVQLLKPNWHRSSTLRTWRL